MMRIFTFLRTWRSRCLQMAEWMRTYGNPWSEAPFFPFVRPHSHIDDERLKKLQGVLECDTGSAPEVPAFARAFCEVMGGGHALPVASARMALHAALRHLGVTDGDEVLVTGFTCSVVLNAILRCGAVPKFVDIDRRTLGTSPESVRRAVTPRTRALIAQHSFGIPCAIDELRDIADTASIKLIEDTAIAFGSKYKGCLLGNWGHASIFSTDHSKPLNTMSGGLFYTLDADLYEKVRNEYAVWPELPRAKQEALLQQVRLERDGLRPECYRRYSFTAPLRETGVSSPFLEADYTPYAAQGDYPYPAKLPAVLAALGLDALKRWPDVARERREHFARLTALFRDQDCAELIPAAFADPGEDIVPLRFVACLPERCGSLQTHPHLLRAVNAFFPASWIWFQEPVVCRTDSLATYGYAQGTCPTAEAVGRGIITIPLDVPQAFMPHFEKCITGLCNALRKVITGNR